MGVAVTRYNLSPKDFWSMSYNEFMQIAITLDPSMMQHNSDFFTEEEQQALKVLHEKHSNNQQQE